MYPIHKELQSQIADARTCFHEGKVDRGRRRLVKVVQRIEHSIGADNRLAAAAGEDNDNDRETEAHIMNPDIEQHLNEANTAICNDNLGAARTHLVQVLKCIDEAEGKPQEQPHEGKRRKHPHFTGG